MNNLLVKIVSAQTNLDPTGDPAISTTEDIILFITKAFQFFFTLVIALSTIFLLYAAFQYVVARGDETKIEKAKSTIIFAVVALIVAVLAWSVPTIISNFFGLGAS